MRISNDSINQAIQNNQQTDSIQKSQTSDHSHSDEPLRDVVMQNTAMRQELTQDLPTHLTRLSGQFEKSKTDFQAQAARQAANVGLPAISNTAAKPVKPSDITSSRSFDRLSPSQKGLVRDVLAQNAGNSQVAGQLKEMIDSPMFFKKLTSNDRSYALNGLAKSPGALAADLLDFTLTASYKGFSKMQKQQGQVIIGLLSADAALNPSHNPTSRNTVLALTTGNVELGLPTKKELLDEGFTPEDLQSLYGFAYENTMYFNVYLPGLLDSRPDMVRTAAHEINHVLNDRDNDTEFDTPERALDEYRSWYMENFAVGINPPTVEYMQGVWENFFSPNAGYDNIREVYLQDPDFRQIVDQIKVDLDRGVVTDPETFRKSLAELIGKDPFIKNPRYLTTPGNLDNTLTPRARPAE
ncbi:MAG: hypothetical protein J0M03_23595 [Acidobacteria bacterium]|nr:hypothetical protein [Acidobacteriota bacterium]